MMKKPAMAGVLLLVLGSLGMTAEADEQLRVITFNMGAGASRMFMPQLMPAADAAGHFAPFLASAAADTPAIVCLQEVDEGRARSGAGKVDDLTAALAQQDGANWQSHYFPLSSFDGDGSTGIAVLSRLPQATRSESWQIYDGAEDRGALAVGFELAGQPVWVVNTHLGFSDPEAQVESLLAGIDSRTTGATVVLCGDMNVPDPAVTAADQIVAGYERTLGLVLNRGFASATSQPEPTFPAWGGEQGMKIDYLFLRGDERVTVSGSSFMAPQTRDRFFSDHRAVAVDLNLAVR